MNLDKLRSQLIRHEGLRLQKYQDSVGVWSIGVGRNLIDEPFITPDGMKLFPWADATQPYGIPLGGLTKTQAMDVLDEDIADTLAFLNSQCPWWQGLNEVRQRAVVDLAFNLMRKLLGFHNMIAAIRAKDWRLASKELLNSKFAKQTGQRAKTLSAMLLTGTDAS